MRVRLTDLCEPKQWKIVTTSQLRESGYPVYGANGIIGYYDQYNHEEPTIMIACRGTCGEVNLSLPKSYINGNAMCLESVDTDSVLLKYLYYVLKNYDFTNIISGTSQPQITKTGLKKVLVPLVGKKEQEEIVRRLDLVGKSIECRERQIETMDLLVKSKFIEMFGNDRVAKAPISDLIDPEIESAKKRYKNHETIRYVDISSVDNQSNVMTGFTVYRFQDAPSRAQQCLKRGDIVVSTVRPNLKNIAMNCFPYDNIVASSGFCVLRAKKCDPSYLFNAVLMDDFSRRMNEVTTGANYPAIKDSDVLSYKIPNPSMTLQNEFARFVGKVNQMRSTVRKNLEKTQTLKNALMQQYFG